jgi:hypothetical protein
MRKKKVFIFLPDGVGLRNFVFSKFYEIGLEKGFDIQYWNNTHLDLNTIGFKEIKIKNAKLHAFTDILKSAKIQIELNSFIRKTSDNIYDSYRFPLIAKNFKSKIKNVFIKCFIKLYNSDKGLKKIRKIIQRLETSTSYYKQCVAVLKKEQPTFVFCTNQRPSIALAPILAAKKNNIPTGTFIFSWDNLPKATMVVETDYYFVWSDFMKNELLFYYPYIKKEQVICTGTPQFEPHFDTSILVDKNVFYKQHNLNLNKKYICFSGDDITTSPNDQFYLEDVAKAVRSLNSKGYNLGIIYRKCPVDFSDRYIPVYKKYKDVITLVSPLWENLGNSWDAVMPTKEDAALLVNTVKYSELVINIGSSMVFDYVAQQKPCAFLNYNTTKTVDSNWNIDKIYKFVHFRSMPSKDVVLWINSVDEIEDVIIEGLKLKDLEVTEKWYKKICGHTPSLASEKIWNAISEITQ